jgi:hypothetical protein
MNQQIIYKQENNKIALASWGADYSAEDIINTLPTGCQYLLVSPKDLPSIEDLQEFFEALQADFNNPSNPNIRIDLELAKEITKDRLRRERVQKFQENDILLRDAVIDNDNEKLSRGIFERDRLRDITQLPDNVSSLDKLRNLHP